jgi:glycosyltransferase involved in cell wall biosynthesis
MPRLRFFLMQFSFSVVAVLWILRRRKSFDIVYSRDLFILFMLFFFQRYIKAKTVYEAHDFPMGKSGFRFHAAKKVDGLVVTTRRIGEYFHSMGANASRILVFPNGVDLKSFGVEISPIEARIRLGIPPEIRMAAYVGNFLIMNREKGIPDIIASARYLLPSFVDLHFYFVGGPLSREQKYRTLIAEAGLDQERFHFLDRQPLADLPLWMKAGDVLLMPLPRTQYFANCLNPIKMMQYMASRRPIVATRLPAIEEILQDGGNALLAEPGDAGGIADRIRTLLENPRLGEKLADRAFADVQPRTWDKRAEEILAFAEKISDREN